MLFLDMCGVLAYYFIPKNLPTLRCRPDFVVGMPVAFAILRLTAVTPTARFAENDSPGMPVFVPLFLAIIQSSFPRHILLPAF